MREKIELAKGEPRKMAKNGVVRGKTMCDCAVTSTTVTIRVRISFSRDEYVVRDGFVSLSVVRYSLANPTFSHLNC